MNAKSHFLNPFGEILVDRQLPLGTKGLGVKPRSLGILDDWTNN